MLKLLRFVESDRNAHWIYTRLGYGACGMCAITTVYIWIQIIREHF
jgi:hypothetical protein